MNKMFKIHRLTFNLAVALLGIVDVGHSHIEACSPFYEEVLTLIPAWLSNYVHHEMWDEIHFKTSTVVLLKFGSG